MRLVVAVTLANGCYSPHPQAGEPCAPAAPSCPSGQMCVSEAGGYFCETHPVIDALVADVSDAPVDARPIDGAILPDAQTVYSYTATVAECIDPTAPDPAFCRSTNGNEQMVADANDSTTGKPWQGYVRFDVDGRIAGRTIASVDLVLTVTNAQLADADSSGAIWKVSAFDKASLAVTTPSSLGAAPVAPAQNNVVKLQVVTFSIPTGLAAANTSVYLGIITSSTNGVNYWNTDGTDPPRLVVTVR